MTLYNIQKPINKLTYDEEFGYYVAAEDVESINKKCSSTK